MYTRNQLMRFDLDTIGNLYNFKNDLILYLEDVLKEYPENEHPKVFQEINKLLRQFGTELTLLDEIISRKQENDATE